MNSLVAFTIIIVNDNAGISTAILAPKAGITAFSHMSTYKDDHPDQLRTYLTEHRSGNQPIVTSQRARRHTLSASA